MEAVAMKLLQRLNYSASVMKTSAASLQDGTFIFLFPGFTWNLIPFLFLKVSITASLLKINKCKDCWVNDSCLLCVSSVQYLKVEVLEMKKALNIVLEKYEALCKRVEQQGPDFLSGPTRAPAFTALGTEISLSEALQQIFRTGSSMVDSKPP